MKIEDILIETPLNIENIDWHYLNDDVKNREMYRIFAIKKFKKVVEQVNSVATIYRDGSQYFCLDTELKRITYYMKFEVGNNGKIGDYVWQSLVWRDFTIRYLSTIPQKMFFKYLLPKFGCILTDSEQSWDGRRFWALRISDAFTMNLNVYFYNFDGHKLVKMNNINDFRQVQAQYDVWGGNDKHRMKRMVITNKILPIR